MEAWRTMWRENIAPRLPTGGLEMLRKALLVDDARLLQAQTVEWRSRWSGLWEEVIGACPVAYCHWRHRWWLSPGNLYAFFWGVEDGCPGKRIGPFTSWWDNGERYDVRRQLLAEVNRELARRAALKDMAGFAGISEEYAIVGEREVACNDGGDVRMSV